MIKSEEYFGDCPEFDETRALIVKYETQEFLGGFKSYSILSVRCEDENICQYIRENHSCPLIEKASN